ncbi:acetyl-CoA acetyltransferase [Lysinibacillus sphaericus]|uniref:thiolase family protein n=1 Tax=Lysinibacillus sphaericus TaxID=1421 RepID=UPI0018CCBA04|nr:thiolase family protein [Lysinibacillus sphaericus]MBG9453215.1 acetyl-CoA acetyltransferase [Lysinibacillus sphaericus]MBG9476070.1 acetyl-CoA acetyltransferase [Lysinibacillus sphaericus]MBG9591918.1 acetyl-CoA acetyltransferase [Lysinibacillus sphaericus]
MVVIVNAFRTPIGKLGGALAQTLPEDLVAHVMQNNLSSVGYGEEILDEIIVGQTKQSTHAPNIARVAALKAKFRDTLSAYTVHRQCGSGLQAVMNAAMTIIAKQADVILAGGVESMSQAPFYFISDRTTTLNGNLTIYDSNIESQAKSQPESIYGTFSMGETAEWLAESFDISREEQDYFAYESQKKAKVAIDKGDFESEIVSIEVKTGKKKTIHFAVDEHPRLSDIDVLAKLQPAFKKDGSVTAGNASGRNDGASMLLLMDDEKAHLLGCKPLAKIVSFAAVGISPKEMGLGPVPAIEQALEKAGLNIREIDLFEINEAFAAQALACAKQLSLPLSKLNVNGGAIALGHPLGMSGARILTTLVHALEKRKLRYGVAAICIAGGQGLAMVVERCME